MAKKPRRSEQAEQPEKEEGKKRRVSSTTLLLGAAGLFLFIVGVKRRYRLDEEREIGERAPRRETGHRWTDATARHELDEDEDDVGESAAD